MTAWDEMADLLLHRLRQNLIMKGLIGSREMIWGNDERKLVVQNLLEAYREGVSKKQQLGG